MSFSSPPFSWWHSAAPLQHRKLERIYRRKICFKIHEVLHCLSNDSIKEKKNEKNRGQLKSDILSSEKEVITFHYRTEISFKRIVPITDILSPLCSKLTYSFLKQTC